MEQPAPVGSVDLRNSQGAILGASGDITQNFGPQTHVAGNAVFVNVGPMPDLGDVLQASQKIAQGFASLGRLLESAPAAGEMISGARASLRMAREQIRRMTEYKETHDLLQQLELSYRTIAVVIYEGGRLLPAQQVSWRALASHANNLQHVAEKLCHYVESASFASNAQPWVRDVRASCDLLPKAMQERSLDALDEAMQLDYDVISAQTTRVNAMLMGALDGLQLEPLAQALSQAHAALAAQPLPAGNALAAEIESFGAGVSAMTQHAGQLRVLRLVHDRWQDLDDHLRREQAQLGEDIARPKRQWERVVKPRVLAFAAAEAPWAAKLRARAERLDAAFAAASAADVEFAYDELRSSVITQFGEVDIDLRNVCGRLADAGGPMDFVLERLR
jgi:hypothetical protein